MGRMWWRRMEGKVKDRSAYWPIAAGTSCTNTAMHGADLHDALERTRLMTPISDKITINWLPLGLVSE